jgi:hypothetical protein
VASRLGFENLYASATARAVEGNLGGFCVCSVATQHKNAPGTGDMPEPLVSELPTGGLARGHMPDRSKFLHSDIS